MVGRESSVCPRASSILQRRASAPAGAPRQRRRSSPNIGAYRIRRIVAATACTRIRLPHSGFVTTTTHKDAAGSEGGHGLHLCTARRVREGARCESVFPGVRGRALVYTHHRETMAGVKKLPKEAAEPAHSRRVWPWQICGRTAAEASRGDRVVRRLPAGERRDRTLHLMHLFVD